MTSTVDGLVMGMLKQYSKLLLWQDGAHSRTHVNTARPAPAAPGGL